MFCHAPTGFNLREELSDVKALIESAASEETCAALHKKYQLLARDYKRLERRLVECQRKQLEVAQHRDIIQNEYARVNLAKSKLESLCRELQRHSKAVTEESKLRQREEEERRKEVSSKFQSTINDITVKMQEHHQRNQALRQENLELATKLKQLSEQYDAREEQFEKILKHKQLELQLCEAKIAQQTVAAAEEKESSLVERQYLLTETLEQQKRCEQLTRQEVDLRGQLSLYSEKFEEFQKTLTRSNEVFSTFKKEMDKMSKTIGMLEKEMIMWKTRYEKCNRSLLEMAEERVVHEHTIHSLKSKNEKLEKLCRALQSERKELNKKLKQPQKSDSSKTSEEPGHTESTAATSDPTTEPHPPPDSLPHPSHQGEDKHGSSTHPKNLEPPLVVSHDDDDSSSPPLSGNITSDTAIKTDGCQPLVDATSTGDDVIGGSEERGNLKASGMSDDDETAGELRGARSAERV